MTYQIFDLIPDIRFEPNGYGTKTVINYTLEQCEYPDRYNSYDEAEEYIKQNVDDFKYQKIVILPVLEIGYNGDIS